MQTNTLRKKKLRKSKEEHILVVALPLDNKTEKQND